MTYTMIMELNHQRFYYTMICDCLDIDFLSVFNNDFDIQRFLMMYTTILELNHQRFNDTMNFDYLDTDS